MEMEQIVKKYYDGLDEGKLLGRKCPRCGAVEFPPVLMCNNCGNLETEWVELSGEGEMFDFSLTSKMSFKKDLENLAPYAFGCVRLAEGTEHNFIVSGVTEDMAERLPIPVKADIMENPRGVKTLFFRVAE